MLSPDEKVAFDVYFASVTSMQYHPGAGTKDHARLSLEECRDVAAQMIALRRKVIEEN
jgi:hypothetical protein